MAYYAVFKGRTKGVYPTWPECQEQVKGLKNAIFKKFQHQKDAQAFAKFGWKAPPPHNQLFPTPSSTPSTHRTIVQVDGASSRLSTNKSSVCTRVLFDNKDPRNIHNRLTQHMTRNRAELLSIVTALQNTKADEKLEIRSSSPSAVRSATVWRNKIEQSKTKDVLVTQIYALLEGRDVVFRYVEADQPLSFVAEVPDPESALGSRTSASKIAVPVPESFPVRVVAYTDGACPYNGQGEASRAGYGVYFGVDNKLNVSERLPGPPTNNRAELYAIKKCLEMVPSHIPLEIRSDSVYSIKSVTVWRKSREERGGVNKEGKEYKNMDLIGAICGMLDEVVGGEGGEKREVTFVHVEGHAGVEGNVQADELAVAGSLLESVDGGDSSSDKDDGTSKDNSDMSTDSNSDSENIAKGDGIDTKKGQEEGQDKDMGKGKEEDKGTDKEETPWFASIKNWMSPK